MRQTELYDYARQLSQLQRAPITIPHIMVYNFLGSSETRHISLQAAPPFAPVQASRAPKC
jgi:hypothetical protein